MGIPTKKRRKYDEKYSIFAKYSAPAALTYYFITNAFQPEMFRIRCTAQLKSTLLKLVDRTGDENQAPEHPHEYPRL